MWTPEDVPRWWFVRRTLGWFGRCRRLSKDYKELLEASKAMVTLAASASCCTTSST
jgi:transposase